MCGEADAAPEPVCLSMDRGAALAHWHSQPTRRSAMNGQGHWLTIAVLLVALSPVVALWLTGWLADRKYRVEQRHVRCRANENKLVQCTVVRDAQTSEP